ncbi:MAG: hypothetical protein IPJ18_09395 [Betaproteobacteria bacterium]|jgi:hypothetical protein|nr:hypothetical protein [Betaproteobacteria bacterium]
MQTHLPLLTRRQLGLYAMFLTATGALAAPLQTVTVRNAQLRVTKELRAWSEVADFHKYWKTKQPINRTSEQEQDWAFTLDIVGAGKAERWQYQSNGMAIRVAADVQQVYQIKNPKAFNELIGAFRF